MRRYFIFFLLFSVFLGVSYWYVQTANICPAPIKYKIGEIDQRFDLSSSELKKILFEAESIWEDTTGRELFVYDEEAKFTVNLIFDERQQMANTEEQWRLLLDKQEKDGLSVMNEVKEMNKDYNLIQDKYTKQRESYESRLAKYNSRVDAYNKSGGAPMEVFENLQLEQKELSRLLEELLMAEQGIQTLVKEINDLGEKGNKMIEDYNGNVQKYNEIFGSREIFTQGDFKRERINVYKFKEVNELTRVIVHEFGHALGIGHVEDKDSVMYHLMADDLGQIILTQDDREALVAVCGDGGFSHIIRQFIRNLLVYF